MEYSNEICQNKKTFAGIIGRIIGGGKIRILNFMQIICCMCPLSAIKGRQPYMGTREKRKIQLKVLEYST